MRELPAPGKDSVQDAKGTGVGMGRRGRAWGPDPLLPQAHSVPGSEGLGPLPPLHGGRLAQLTVQSDRGPFHGLFLLQIFCELGRQGWRWSETHKHYHTF